MEYAILFLPLTASIISGFFNKIIGGYYADKGYGIKSTSDGGFIISGISQSIPGNYGNLEAVLIKTDPFGNTIELD